MAEGQQLGLFDNGGNNNNLESLLGEVRLIGDKLSNINTKVNSMENLGVKLVENFSNLKNFEKVVASNSYKILHEVRNTNHEICSHLSSINNNIAGLYQVIEQVGHNICQNNGGNHGSGGNGGHSSGGNGGNHGSSQHDTVNAMYNSLLMLANKKSPLDELKKVHGQYNDFSEVVQVMYQAKKSVDNRRNNFVKNLLGDTPLLTGSTLLALPAYSETRREQDIKASRDKLDKEARQSQRVQANRARNQQRLSQFGEGVIGLSGEVLYLLPDNQHERDVENSRRRLESEARQSQRVQANRARNQQRLSQFGEGVIGLSGEVLYLLPEYSETRRQQRLDRANKLAGGHHLESSGVIQLGRNADNDITIRQKKEKELSQKLSQIMDNINPIDVLGNMRAIEAKKQKENDKNQSMLTKAILSFLPGGGGINNIFRMVGKGNPLLAGLFTVLGGILRALNRIAPFFEILNDIMYMFTLSVVGGISGANRNKPQSTLPINILKDPTSTSTLKHNMGKGSLLGATNHMTKQELENLVKNDPRFEKLKSQRGFQIATGQMVNDIAYGRKGSQDILSTIGQEFGGVTLTSALGSMGTKDRKGNWRTITPHAPGASGHLGGSGRVYDLVAGAGHSNAELGQYFLTGAGNKYVRGGHVIFNGVKYNIDEKGNISSQSKVKGHYDHVDVMFGEQAYQKYMQEQAQAQKEQVQIEKDNNNIVNISGGSNKNNSKGAEVVGSIAMDTDTTGSSLFNSLCQANNMLGGIA